MSRRYTKGKSKLSPGHKQVKLYAEGGMVGDDYNTDVGDKEADFQKWKSQNAPRDSGADYDLRGAYKSGGTKDPETGHWKDTFKKPNHPTFSDQSKYATGDQRDRAGHWNGDDYVPPANK